MTTYGADTSHWKWTPGIDFMRMKASGHCDYLIAKASEGYYEFADPSYAGWRSGSKNAGMLFGSFHFARPGDPVAQADYYLTVAKPVDGELVCLDLEDLAIPDAGNFGAAFCQRVKAKTGTWPLLYTYPDFLKTRDLSPIQKLGCPLWFADYSDPLNSIAPWSAYAIRQFTSTGSVPGLPATDVDLNSSPLTLDQLRGLAIGAASPAPQPALEDDDMILIQSPGRGTALLGPGYFRVLDKEQMPVHIRAYGDPITGNDREFDLLKAGALQGVTLSPAAVAAAVAKLLPADGDGPVDVDELASKVVDELLGHIKP